MSALRISLLASIAAGALLAGLLLDRAAAASSYSSVTLLIDLWVSVMPPNTAVTVTCSAGTISASVPIPLKTSQGGTADGSLYANVDSHINPIALTLAGSGAQLTSGTTITCRPHFAIPDAFLDAPLGLSNDVSGNGQPVTVTLPNPPQTTIATPQMRLIGWTWPGYRLINIQVPVTATGLPTNAELFASCLAGPNGTFLQMQKSLWQIPVNRLARAKLDGSGNYNGPPLHVSISTTVNTTYVGTGLLGGEWTCFAWTSIRGTPIYNAGPSTVNVPSSPSKYYPFPLSVTVTAPPMNLPPGH